MSLADERLAEALAAYDEPAPGGEHPDPEALWALAADELAPADSRRLWDHVAACPACAEDLRLTRALAREQAAAGETSAARARPAPATRRAVWAPTLAAAAVLLIAVGIGLRLQPRDPGPLRAGGEETVRSLLDPGAPLARDDARLRWRGPEDARYDVVVTTETLDLVAEARELETPELLIPASELVALEDGAVLLWQVDAVLPDGRRVSSHTFDARLAGGRDDGG